MNKCIMLDINNQQYFLDQDNLLKIMRYTEVFEPNVKIVKKLPNGAKISTLEELAVVICETPIKNQEIIEQAEQKTRDLILKNSKRIRKEIEKKFYSKETVSLQDMNSKFKKYGLTLACICNHIKKIREKLQTSGYEVVKVGGGKYKIK